MLSDPKTEVFGAILEVYAFRVNNTEALMQVKSFGMAIANRLIEFNYTQDELELAMCALERRFDKLPVIEEYEKALAKYAPTAYYRAIYCPECGCWRNHRLDCSK